MNEYTVTYHLKPEQEAAIKAIADENGSSVEKEFALMMQAGSWWDIDKKIEGWQFLHENGKRNRATAE